MGKFDGILLASDWDGTLYYNGMLCQKDIDAIRYFQENGGKFTIASGRALPFMRDFFNQIKPNTYCITLNGAIIIHPDSEEILHEGALDDKVGEILEKIISAKNYFQNITFYFKNNFTPQAFTPEEYIQNKQIILKKEIYKILLISDAESKALESKKMLERIGYDNYIFVRSWNISLEILSKENGKGASLRRLANHLGSRLTVAVGDFENDIQMLEMADIGYAVGNSADAVKAIANRVTVPAYNGAIAQIISDLENET